MNNTTRFIMGIYQVSLMIRDTLEYIQPKEAFDVNFYKQRKAYIEHGLVPQSPLSKFLSQNGETGTQIKNNLDEFYNAVYGAESTIVSLDGDKVVVDRAQNIKLLDYIVGLHETLQDIEKGFLAQSQKDGTYEEDFAELLKFDEKYFRAILCINCVDLIHSNFVEFNKAMQQSKGEASPASNFILNDIKRVVGLLKFENEHANKEDEGFEAAYSASFKMLQFMEGSEKPAEGKTIRDQIIEARKCWEVEIGKNEPEWRVRYQSLWGALVEFEKALQNK